MKIDLSPEEIVALYGFLESNVLFNSSSQLKRVHDGVRGAIINSLHRTEGNEKLQMFDAWASGVK